MSVNCVQVSPRNLPKCSSMKKLMVIGHTWPEPKTTAAGHRMMQLLDAFLEESYVIYFGSPAAKTEFSEDLEKVGVEEVDAQLNHSSFDELLLQLKPDVVLFDRFLTEEQFGWRVAENAPNALRILNTEDLHSLRDYREKAIKKGESFENKSWLATDKAKREMASIFRSDVTLVVSDFEERLLIEEVGVSSSHVLHLPFMLKDISEDAYAELPSFTERTEFICVGNGRHAPNIDSIQYLHEKIWPGIKAQLPDAELYIYGAYLPKSIQQLHNEKEGFLVKGWVEDLDAILQKTRINLAPLRFGAGIKGKLIDAMRNGLPSITTSIGAEGMHGDLPWPGAIHDNPEEFAKAAFNLYQNDLEWTQAQQNGAEILNKLYNQDKLKSKLFRALETIFENLPGHRSKNFVGSMLQHQTAAATKFMGKWIEEKNKTK